MSGFAPDRQRRTGAVIGWPIAHSLSPLIHTAWIRAAGLDAVYTALGAPDEDAFDRIITAGREGLFSGVNVTAPWKLRALEAADTASDTATACGSANLLVFRDGRVHADSTDGYGVMRALSDQAPALDVTAAPALIIGAGGAARAAAAALLASGAPEVLILNRSRERAEALGSALGPRVRVLAGPSDIPAEARLAINAVSGANAFDFATAPGLNVAMDMTYFPLETPFLAAGRQAGLTTVDGLGMLVGQAEPAFEAIFGQPPPPVDVRALALAQLEASA